MQQLLCAQDDQVKKWKTEVCQLKKGKSQVDRLLSEALRKEQNMGKELKTLRGQVAQFPEVQSRLAEAEAEVIRLRAQEDELEKIKKQLAEMEDYKAQLMQKEREMEEMQAKNLSTSQELATATGKFFWSEETRRYLMTTGISQIVAKCRASHEFGKLVGRLTSDIQAMGKTDLVRELQPTYFPNEKLEDVPGYNTQAEDLAESAFRSLRYEPVAFHILSELAARPDMGIEEINRLENPDLLSGQGQE